MYYELFQTCKSEEKEKLLLGSTKYLERFHLSSKHFFHNLSSTQSNGNHAWTDDFIEFRYYWLKGIINTLLKNFISATFYFDSAKAIFKQFNHFFPPPPIVQQCVFFFFFLLFTFPSGSFSFLLFFYFFL